LCTEDIIDDAVGCSIKTLSHFCLKSGSNCALINQMECIAKILEDSLASSYESFADWNVASQKTKQNHILSLL